ncbi:MAG: hypothetical protein K0Q73_5379 [Paenibacillus sp.]|jgi:hypothetical protein|nr:hypothetical protein [Paenibacillus sp.]
MTEEQNEEIEAILETLFDGYSIEQSDVKLLRNVLLGTKQLTSELEQSKQLFDNACYEVEQLQQQNKQLIEALKWYSNEENYLLYAKNPRTPIERDFGYLAKRTLQQIQGKE